MKIFGIGLMKTGTVSCAEALRLLGYSVAHFDELRAIMEETGGWLAGDFRTDWLTKHDAVFDNPVPGIFTQLDKKYPHSKFILTTRDLDSWLESCRKYLSAVPAGYEYRKLVRTAVYGMFDFNEERWREIYEQHHKKVREYFKDRPEALLEVKISEGEGWEKLCPLLGKPVPQVPFPKINTYPDYVFE